MIDHTNLQTNIETPQEIRDEVNRPFEYRNLLFVPNYNNRGAIKHYQSEWRGMYIKLRGDYISITNSLQKFYCGDNCGDFHRSEIEIAVNEIADYFHVAPQMWKIIATEIGVNIIPEQEEQVYLDLLHLHKGKKFSAISPRKGRSKVIGVECARDEYRIKLYNKRLQVHLPGRIELPYPLLRFEVPIERKIKIHLPFIHNLSDLYNQDKLFQIGEFLKNKFDEIIMRPETNFSQLKKLEEKVLVAAMQNPAFRHALKRDHPHSVKKYSRIYKSFCNGLKSGLVEELKEKISNSIEKQVNG